MKQEDYEPPICPQCGGVLKIRKSLEDYGVDIEAECPNCGWNDCITEYGAKR